MALDLTITYEDGTTRDVRAGQREMSDWEAQPFGCSSLEAFNVKPVTYFRYLAWAVLKRTDGLKTAWPRWSEGVDEVKLSGDEPDDRPDPTKQSRPREA